MKRPVDPAGCVENPVAPDRDAANSRKGFPHLLGRARPAHRLHRQGREDPVAGVHFQSYGGEPTRSDCGATHRSGQLRRIGAGEHRGDEPGRLPVGRQREHHGVEHHALAQQFAAHQLRTRFQVAKRRYSIMK